MSSRQFAPTLRNRIGVRGGFHDERLGGLVARALRYITSGEAKQRKAKACGGAALASSSTE